MNRFLRDWFYVQCFLVVVVDALYLFDKVPVVDFHCCNFGNPHWHGVFGNKRR